MNQDEYRRSSLESWESMSTGWERRRAEIEETSAPVREWLISELALAPADTVLELAAGPGDTGFAAAAIVGEHGRLISTDVSPGMVEVARRRGAELGLRNVDYRTMDAERIELEDDSVDAVLCRFGYMLVAEPAVALAETRRVLRPGGRLGLAVWRSADLNPWMAVAGRMLVERGHLPPPEPGTPGPFRLASEERVRALLEDAGFSVARTDDVPVQFVYRDVDDYVERARDTGGGFSRAWAEASDDERTAMSQWLAEAFARFEVDRRYEIPGLALVVAAS
jgi:SAM-dependent methyltransferase